MRTVILELPDNLADQLEAMPPEERAQTIATALNHRPKTDADSVREAKRRRLLLLDDGGPRTRSVEEFKTVNVGRPFPYGDINAYVRSLRDEDED